MARVTKTEKLLKAIARRKNGMTRKEMVTFLLKGSGLTYEPTLDSNRYNATLYGTSTRYGILERFCSKTSDGKYKVIRPIAAPFTTTRRQSVPPLF